ncbi:hypothetical protein BJ165DRAFT_863396 [Panaeolus papilionaceus]|nr:hypothetical protein BJ165DRAFT_863396 [Panaeolus papilionaceus]
MVLVTRTAAQWLLTNIAKQLPSAFALLLRSFAAPSSSLSSSTIGRVHKDIFISFTLPSSPSFPFSIWYCHAASVGFVPRSPSAQIRARYELIFRTRTSSMQPLLSLSFVPFCICYITTHNCMKE